MLGVHGLALETSGRLGSVAITSDGTLLARDEFEHGLKHAAEIIPRIDRLLKQLTLRPIDLREIFVSVGPGSFTGLRIGVTLAKTLAFATGAKIVAVPTVNVLAENAPPQAKNLIIVLDAKRDQIFTARFARSAEGEPWSTVEPARLDALAAMIERSPRPVHLLGEGLPFHEKFIPAESGVIATPAPSWRARAEVVARLGDALARASQFTDPKRLLPIYIRKPEAQEKWEAQNAANENPPSPAVE